MQKDITLSFDEIAVKRIYRYPNRPTIVFLHDSLGCIELWREFPEKLGELARCNVLIYDRQGYGKSCPFSYRKRDQYYMELEADILDQLLDFWGVEDAILWGHSDGGSIALIMAGKYPDNILGVISEGAHIFVEDITIAGIEKAIELYRTTDLKQKLQKYHGKKTDEMFWAWADTWTSKTFRNWNIESFLPHITCPSLVIQGSYDEYGTMKQVHDIVDQTRGTTSKLLVPNAKHSPHKEKPDLILEESARFIDDVILG